MCHVESATAISPGFTPPLAQNCYFHLLISYRIHVETAESPVFPPALHTNMGIGLVDSDRYRSKQQKDQPQPCSMTSSRRCRPEEVAAAVAAGEGIAAGRSRIAGSHLVRNIRIERKIILSRLI